MLQDLVFSVPPVFENVKCGDALQLSATFFVRIDWSWRFCFLSPAAVWLQVSVLDNHNCNTQTEICAKTWDMRVCETQETWQENMTGRCFQYICGSISSWQGKKKNPLVQFDTKAPARLLLWCPPLCECAGLQWEETPGVWADHLCWQLHYGSMATVLIVCLPPFLPRYAKPVAATCPDNGANKAYFSVAMYLKQTWKEKLFVGEVGGNASVCVSCKGQPVCDGGIWWNLWLGCLHSCKRRK